MCRLLGNIATEKRLEECIFHRLVEVSKKGGPDNTSFYQDEIVQFGFNRLSILDTSESGNQPIISPSGRYVLMLNGEIYNYKDLATQHSITGLRSGSDAEVVAHLIDKLNIYETIRALNGMFAVSIWDTQNRQLYLARDFAGIKPLFYSKTSSGFIFGSQFNQLLKHPWQFSWQFSTTGLREYLQFGYMPGPHTIAEGVFQLDPGTMLFYDLATHQYKISRYKQFFHDPDREQLEETDKETIARVEEALSNAVKRQLVSDVPLGVFLSGGIDSTIVSALASKHRPDLTSLTIGFEDKDLDESSQAALYAQSIGIQNKKIVLSEQELLAIMDEHFIGLTEPLADYSSLPTYLISQVAAQDFKVMLSGDGGDELFWGYPRFRTFVHSAPFFKIPGRFARKVAKKSLKTLGMDITGFLGEKDLGSANLEFHSYLGTEFLNEVYPNSSISATVREGYKHYGSSQQEALSYLRRNEFYYHLQKVLVKVDRMSMANGLEVRVPLLDEEVLNIAQKISPSLHTHKDLKYVLKKVLYNHVPESMVAQKKKGFTPPLRRWSKTILREEIKREIGQLSARLNMEIGQQYLDEYTSQYMLGRHNNLEGIWTLYVLSKWLVVNDLVRN